MALESFYVIQCRNKKAALPSRQALDALSDALTRAMTVRDGLTQQHSERVRQLALALAREVGVTDSLMLDAIHGASLLHDIGKLGIPDLLLLKPGPLTRDEFERVKEHVTIGADILTAAAFPSPLTLIVRHHHENWDGTGYPDRLQGQAIPVGARVLAIVDCYDALTSDRPYRRALSHGSAVAMIHERRGTMYDADVTDAFLRIVQRLRSAPPHSDADRPRTRANAPWLEARAG
jgi:putative nucleotidyltransferase with HDIG domain